MNAEILDRPPTEVFSLLADLCTENGAANIKDLPGCYTLALDKAFIAVNGSMTKDRTVKTPDGLEITVKPVNALVVWNGWPVYIGNPFGGVVMFMTEDELISKIRSLFKNAQGFAA